MNYEVSVMAKRIEVATFFCGMTFEVKDDPLQSDHRRMGGGIGEFGV